MWSGGGVEPINRIGRYVMGKSHTVCLLAYGRLIRLSN